MNNAIEEENDVPVLSSSALDALKEFYADRDARAKAFEDLKAGAEDEAQSRAKWSMESFQEDWNESQFWYSDETATALAEELLDGAEKDTSIAVVSAPSVFVQLKNILAEKPEDERPKIWLLEYDKRFEVFGDEFLFYDFKDPLKLPPSIKSTIDRIIVDPPFLSEDCQTKAALTVRTLLKSQDPTGSRLIACTGERMSTLINKLYRAQGIRTTTFEPVHEKGLSNEFFCYANFECKRWTFRVSKEGAET
ncbi:N-6 adenine-specific DNA methyltransferase-like protein 2 [Mollisia scopiformis]|uniref:Protein-lysine N-methyltransferase EFM5 n=1 Tax=Mollisia scopiformis TaxID=149040 RepID=A0A194X3G0_MOLSC|nr:N-6 adenine-specific DNA methyltransferase-like protein 2 [Mollisia scopiformis]KUJ14735.1 N-6 adenine-specific DNA methyltransferas-like protein 2 [Mollisia scopiformis]